MAWWCTDTLCEVTIEAAVSAGDVEFEIVASWAKELPAGDIDHDELDVMGVGSSGCVGIDAEGIAGGIAEGIDMPVPTSSGGGGPANGIPGLHCGSMAQPAVLGKCAVKSQ